MRWAGHAARMDEMNKAYKILVGKLEGKDNLEDLGIVEKIILKWIRWTVLEDVDWIHLSQDRDRRQALLNTVMTLGVP
jgi:hypothetical protein